jgi:ADP-ribosylation factor GTPase-activating protein 1
MFSRYLGGLGVHISFVRSVTMDKWKDIEIEKMRVGGNKKAKEFLNAQDSWNESDTFAKKYNSVAAALYRDKIAALADGKDWSIEDAKRKVEQQNKHMHHSKSTGALSDYSQSKPDAEFSYQNANTREFKDQKEQFFNRIQMDNANRPSDLPPNQGGKYAGFGNQAYNPPPPRSQSEFFDTTLSSLSSGWSMFSSSATKLASSAKDNALKYGSYATQKVTI